MPARSDAPPDGPRRVEDSRTLLFVAGLAVLAAILATWHSRSIARHYSPALASARVDVNHAQPDDLAALPGIGAALAQRIVAVRAAGGRFRDVDDLIARVDGLGALAAVALAPRIAFGD